MNLDFPIKFDVDYERLADADNRLRNLLSIEVALILGGIVVIIVLLVLLIWELLFPSESYITFISGYIIFLLILPPFIGIIIWIPHHERKVIHETILSKHSILILRKREINYQVSDFVFKIPISEHFMISYYELKNPSNKSKYWSAKIDGLTLRTSYKTDDLIKFAPVLNFAKKYCVIFFYSILSKAKSGFYLSRDALLEKRIKKVDLSHKEPMKVQENNQVEHQDIKEFKIDQITLDDIDDKTISNFIKEDEKILLKHIPNISFRTDIFLEFVNFLHFGLYFFILFFVPTNYQFWKNFVCFLTFIPIFFWCGHYCVLSNKRDRKKILTIFTDQKVISKMNGNYITVLYKNIERLEKTKTPFQDKIYDINIVLKILDQRIPHLNK
ncbi:MAG: hypothetical protein GF317_12680 [Candidatus Lokiarchaeota archaeon]|nr:hypothetical protein [Candidatus Lokiarchaeota archaeon]MBD3200503.1 hypothetical protein [Candidatus Lokiarchaeota archaeon]